MISPTGFRIILGIAMLGQVSAGGCLADYTSHLAGTAAQGQSTARSVASASLNRAAANSTGSTSALRTSVDNSAATANMNLNRATDAPVFPAEPSEGFLLGGLLLSLGLFGRRTPKRP